MLAKRPDASPLLLPRRLVAGHWQSPLVLGTVQLGMPYGSVRRMRLPSEADAVAILRRAIACGVTHIDTARAYGESEHRVGRALAEGWTSRAQVVTKLDPLADIPGDAAPARVEAAVGESIRRSCHELGMTTLPLVLLHRASHRTAWSGTAWRTLLALRADGTIGALGVSAADPAEVLEAAADADVRLIQLPFNILDGRFAAAGVPAVLARRPDLTVHARSAFLQGILAQTGLDAWPRIAGLDAKALAAWLRNETSALARTSVADLCLAYARAQPWIHGIVVGVENSVQLDDTLRMIMRPPLTEDAAHALARRRPPIPPDLLNPAVWSV